MIAQIVFDLPLEGPFDYLVPEHLVSQIAIGSRVKVFFGPKRQTGFVVGLLEKSVFNKLKPVQSLPDASPVFNSLDLTFARDFSAYYGCSLGEALGTMLRNKKEQKPSIHRDHKPQLSLYRCQPDSYSAKIQEIIDGCVNSMSFPSPSLSFPRKRESSFLILVPDAFRGQTLSQQLGPLPIKIGTRSVVFECDGRYDCVIMVDQEDSSYKQEQMPMYDTAQVLLTRSKMFGFDVAFVGISPSVELMALIREGKIKDVEEPTASFVAARLVDLSNYKFVPGLISPPLRDGLEASLKAGQKSLLVLNHKGIKTDEVKTELKKQFPQAKIISFERESKKLNPKMPQIGADADIIIATQAILRFQGRFKAHFVAFLFFDAELNRLDTRSAFHAFSLALHISSMASEGVFIQTRNSGHYVLQSLVSGKPQSFYNEELKLRKELGFSPFKHWIKISWRGKSEKSTQEYALQVYNVLSQSAAGEYNITPPLSDAVSRKHDWFRFNVMVQADSVSQAVAFIKSTLAQIKRRSRVIVTLNVDP